MSLDPARHRRAFAAAATIARELLRAVRVTRPLLHRPACAVEPLEGRRLLSTVVMGANGDAGFEGQPRAVFVSAYAVPDDGEDAPDGVAISGFDVTWGDGATTHTGAVMDYTGNWSPAEPLTHVYDAVGSYQVGVTATASDGDAAHADVTIDVTDAPIHAYGGDNLEGVADTPVTGTVAFFTDEDPNSTPSDFTATIDWGDGSTGSGTVTWNAGANRYEVTGTHTYAQGGSFAVHVLVEDQDGASDSADASARVGPRVSVAAVTDGSEDGDAPAVVRFTRQGPTDGDLTVYFTLAGNATPDTSTTTDPDYVPPSVAYYDTDGNPVYSVTIADGDASSDVSFTPENDALCEGGEGIQVAMADPPPGTQPTYKKEGGPATAKIGDLVAQGAPPALQPTTAEIDANIDKLRDDSASVRRAGKTWLAGHSQYSNVVSEMKAQLDVAKAYLDAHPDGPDNGYFEERIKLESLLNTVRPFDCDISVTVENNVVSVSVSGAVPADRAFACVIDTPDVVSGSTIVGELISNAGINETVQGGLGVGQSGQLVTCRIKTLEAAAGARFVCHIRIYDLQGNRVAEFDRLVGVTLARQ